MNDKTAAKTNGDTEKKPEVNKPDAPAQPQAKQPTYRAAIVPQQLMQQVIDLLRDEPIARKKTDPIVPQLERAQYVDVPVGKVG